MWGLEGGVGSLPVGGDGGEIMGWVTVVEGWSVRHGYHVAHRLTSIHALITGVPKTMGRNWWKVDERRR